MWESKWGNYELPIILDPEIRSHQLFIEIFENIYQIFLLILKILNC